MFLAVFHRHTMSMLLDYFKRKQSGKGQLTPAGPLSIRIASHAIVAVNMEVDEELNQTMRRTASITTSMYLALSNFVFIVLVTLVLNVQKCTGR